MKDTALVKILLLIDNNGKQNKKSNSKIKNLKSSTTRKYNKMMDVEIKRIQKTIRKRVMYSLPSWAKKKLINDD